MDIILEIRLEIYRRMCGLEQRHKACPYGCMSYPQESACEIQMQC